MRVMIPRYVEEGEGIDGVALRWRPFGADMPPKKSLPWRRILWAASNPSRELGKIPPGKCRRRRRGNKTSLHLRHPNHHLAGGERGKRGGVQIEQSVIHRQKDGPTDQHL